MADGSIKKDPIFLTRIIIKNEQNVEELKGRILISNMIPVNEIALKKYNPSFEKDLNYKTLVIKELDFITKNREKIVQKANIIYNQKIGVYKTSIYAQKYLQHVVNFKLLEDKSKLYKSKK